MAEAVDDIELEDLLVNERFKPMKKKVKHVSPIIDLEMRVCSLLMGQIPSLQN